MNDAEPGRPAAANRWDIGFAVVVLAASTAALAFWFPNDIKGGFIERGMAGRLQPGDPFFPILLASTIAGLAVLDLGLTVFRRKPAEDGYEPGRLTVSNIRFFFLFHTAIFVGMALMYWVGPLVVASLHGAGLLEESNYHHLVDTVPFKYLGFLVGGFAMTMSLTAWAEGAWTRRALISVALVLAGSVLIFDVLLNNVQLPPNANY